MEAQLYTSDQNVPKKVSGVYFDVILGEAKRK